MTQRAGQLRVQVVSGDHIPARASGDHQCYCVLRMTPVRDEQLRYTSTGYCSCPRWDQEFYLDVWDPAVNTLAIILLHQHEETMASNVGKANVKLDTLCQGKPCRFTIPLYYQVEGQWAPHPQATLTLELTPLGFGLQPVKKQLPTSTPTLPTTDVTCHQNNDSPQAIGTSQHHDEGSAPDGQPETSKGTKAVRPQGSAPLSVEASSSASSVLPASADPVCHAEPPQGTASDAPGCAHNSTSSVSQLDELRVDEPVAAHISKSKRVPTCRPSLPVPSAPPDAKPIEAEDAHGQLATLNALVQAVCDEVALQEAQDRMTIVMEEIEARMILRDVVSFMSDLIRPPSLDGSWCSAEAATGVAVGRMADGEPGGM